MQRGKARMYQISRFAAISQFFFHSFSAFKHALSLKVNIGFPLANKG